MKKRVRSHIALYGNVGMVRRYCADCCEMTLVIKGDLACCGGKSYADPDRFKRMTQPEQARRLPPVKERDKQLEKQENRCLYCELEFGSVVLRNGTPVRLKLCWDHMVPYVYSQNNESRNFAAACQVCNGIKSDRCFQGVDSAREFIAQRRSAKGYL